MESGACHRVSPQGLGRANRRNRTLRPSCTSSISTDRFNDHGRLDRAVPYHFLRSIGRPRKSCALREGSHPKFGDIVESGLCLPNAVVVRGAYELVKKKRRRTDSNRCIKVLQTSPLPLGYGALVQL